MQSGWGTLPASMAAAGGSIEWLTTAGRDQRDSGAAGMLRGQSGDGWPHSVPGSAAYAPCLIRCYLSLLAGIYSSLLRPPRSSLSNFTSQNTHWN